ncbi:MAG: DUF11 domain-containing protein [Nocardioidaceae bacterium]|nr:DUF11 domain-containing protein [Nocardioidaceae bacterium]
MVRGLGALLLAALVAVVPGTGPAQAVLGTPVPFDPNIPQQFLVQNPNTPPTASTYVLQRAVVQANGSVSYVNEGTIGIAANGIAFNQADGFVYGIDTSTRQLVKIGQNGVYSVMPAGCALPNTTNNAYLDGAIVNGVFYSYDATSSTTTSFVMQKIDLATCTRTSYTVTGLSNAPSAVNLPFDLTYADGYFWGVNDNGYLLRIPTSAGAVQTTNVSSLVPTGSYYGAAWTMGNGNPVFQNNASGDFFQLDTTALASGGSATLISRLNAPAAGQNDGTFAAGQQVDLGITKQGAATYQSPQSFTYTFTVTNNGPGASSGAVVQDQLPSGMTYSSSSVACFNYATQPSLPACASGNTNLGFSIPPIAINGTFTYTLTVNIATGTAGTKTNTGTIIPNEADINPANNVSSTKTNVPISCTPGTIYALDGSGSYSLLKVDPATGSSSLTSNFNAPPPASDGTQYVNALAIAPGGTAAYAVSTPSSSAGVVYIQKYDPSTGSVAQVGSINVGTNMSAIGGAFDPTTGRYWVMVYNQNNGWYEFYAFDTSTNTSLGRMFSYPFNTDLTLNGNGDLAFDATGRLYVLMNNSSNRSEIRTFGPPLPSGNLTSSSGQVVASPVDPVTVQANGLAFGGDGYLYTEGADGTGGQTVIRKIDPATGDVLATINLTQPDGTADILSRDLASCTNPSTITLQKDIVGRKVATDQFGLSITGNGLSLNNTGTTSGSTTGLQTDDPAVAGPVLAIPGKTYTITETGASGANLANYLTTYQCVDTLNNNAVVASGSTSSGSLTMPGVSTSGSNVVCTFTNTPTNPSITLTKTPNRTTLVTGQTVTYTFVAKNTGNVPLTNVTISETSFNGSGTAPVVTGCSPAAGSTLAPNATMTCTATYVVTQADVDRYVQNSTQLNNTAQVVGTPPTGANVTATANASIPALVLTKTAGTVSGPDSSGNYTATYTITVRNRAPNAATTYGPLTDTPAFSSNLNALSAAWTFTSSSGGTPVTGSATGAGPYTLSAAGTPIASGETHTYAVTITFRFTNTSPATACAGSGTGLFNTATIPGQSATACDTPPTRYDVYLHKVGKNASGATVSLAGSAWQLQADASGAPGPVIAGGVQAVTGQVGEFKMTALAPGTYWLTETTSPSGYVLLAEPIKFVVSSTGAVSVSGGGDSAISVGTTSSGQPEITVGDPRSLTLPAAGGSGASMFAVGGSALLLLAVVVALIRSRSSSGARTGKRVRT